MEGYFIIILWLSLSLKILNKQVRSWYVHFEYFFTLRNLKKTYQMLNNWDKITKVICVITFSFQEELITWFFFYTSIICRSHKKTLSFRLYVFPSFRLYVFPSFHLYVFPSLRLYVFTSFFTRIYEPTLPLMIYPYFWAVLSPFPSKREGHVTVPSFALWLNFWILQYPNNSHIFRLMIYTSW